MGSSRFLRVSLFVMMCHGSTTTVGQQPDVGLQPIVKQTLQADSPATATSAQAADQTKADTASGKTEATGGKAEATGANTQSPTVNSEATDIVYWDQVSSVLQKRCYACHRGDQPRGGLDVSSLAAVESGSASGPVVVSGQPLRSPLFLLPAHIEEPMMPPNSPRMPQRELDLIQNWISGGLQTRELPQSATGDRPAATRTLRRRPESLMHTSTRPLPYIAPAGNLNDQRHAASKDLSSLLTVARRPARNEHTVTSAITSIAINPAASLVAAATGDSVLIYHWADQSLHNRFVIDDGDVCSMRFSPDGQLLLISGGTGAESGFVMGVAANSGEPLFRFSQPNDVVLTADLSADGRLLAFAGPTKKVSVMDTVTGQLIYQLGKHTDWILQARFSADGLLLATADRFGSIQICEAKSGREFATLRGHTGPVSSLHWTPDSDHLISMGHDGTLRRWNMHDTSDVTVTDPGMGPLLTADSYADGRIVLGGRDGLWQIQTADQTRNPVQLNGDCTQTLFTHDGLNIITADLSGQLQIFDAASGTRITNLALTETSGN